MTKLYRSRSDRYITGLCGGLSDTFGIDSTWIRLLLVITAFFSGGVIIPLYFLAVLVIPKEPRNHGPYGPYGPGYGFDGAAAGATNWNGQATGPQWGQQQQWGNGWNGKKHGCGFRKHNRNDRRQHEAEYQNTQGHSQGNSQSNAGDNLDEMMKDIEKKAMWKEIEELRAKVAQYEKNQQTKGDV
ncbi:PspC domain-containing protein [Paenibacillus agricola]|uniref:PspC domain-containing protein n=1 Tax=Paenibacillus agricola TaxID=2716264 RepID=A0ABX0JH63_9BACL|nr:PspC domain-containing protein [Paenibacillus agricola]NHN34576.1 PspC domain-containing protein [Paenibacillus agricola]